MRRIHARLAAIGIVALLNTGCATITRGTTEALIIETTPTGAEVALSTGIRCKTPCSIELKRKNDVVVDITKDGYDPVRVNVLSQIAGAGAAGMAGNVVFGGIIGAGVDAVSGATKQLKPNPVVVTLVPTSSTSPAVTPSVDDAVQQTARQRCSDLGHQADTEQFRSCLSEQVKAFGGD